MGMKLKWLGSIVIVISMIILAIITIMKIKVIMEDERVIMEYVRKRPLRTRAYCWYPISKDYKWANFANVKKITFMLKETEEDSFYRVKIETYAPIPTKTKDLLSFSLFFHTSMSLNEYELGVIYAKNYPFSSPPPSPNGGVFTLFGDKLSWFSKIRASVKDSLVVIDFPHMVKKSFMVPKIFVVHYLPENIKLKLPKGRSAGSVVGCDILILDPKLEKRQIVLPLQP